jgi:predicted DNA-binding transcriptional regulator AlpA
MNMKLDQLKEAEAAEQLGVTKATLANWRWRKYGPAYLKVGRKVRYLQDDIDAWTSDQRRNPAAS